jgi:hypothetical protein
MEKRLQIILILVLPIILIISTNLAVSFSSSMLSDFNVAGCRTNSEFMPYQTCSRYGTFWCDGEGRLWNVLRDKGKCRGMDSAYRTLDDCCPPNYFCNNSEEICTLRPFECSDFIEQTSCENNGCIWFEKNIGNWICIDRRKLISCSDYKRNSTCTRDVFGLGKTTGLGTQICKGMYIGTKMVLIDSCRCSWDGTGEITGNCTLTYNIGSDDPDSNKIFTCNKFFNLGECIAGEQNISWRVFPESWGLSLSAEELAIFGCIKGNHIINCGNSFIKLPFFSLFDFYISVLIIFFIYLCCINSKKRKN